jgi:hypothetical protein
MGPLSVSHQAGKVRTDKGTEWINLNGQGIDSRRAYACNLRSGRSIGLFFYDGVVSRAVAFEKLLFSGVNLARRLTGRFDPEGDKKGCQELMLVTLQQ